MPDLFTYTGADVASEVKSQFGDTGGVQITDVHLLRWINNGQRSIASATPILEQVFVTNLLANQTVYDLNSLMAAERMQSYSSIMANGRKLEIVPWSKYQALIAGDPAVTTYPAGTPAVASEYGGKLSIWPQSSASVVGGLVVYYIAWPDDLQDISEPLTIPDRFRNALVAYVLGKAYELGEDFEASASQLEQHNTGITLELQRDSMNPTDFYPTITYDERDLW